MHKQKIVIIIAALIGGIGTFLPWAEIPFVGSINGTEGDGWITLGLFAVPLLLALLSKSDHSLRSVKLVIASITSLLAAGVGLIDLNEMTSTTGGDDIFSALVGEMINVGPGLYVIIVAGIALPVLAFLLQGPKPIKVAQVDVTTSQEPIKNEFGFCGNCGSKITQKDVFCPNCGEKVKTKD